MREPMGRLGMLSVLVAAATLAACEVEDPRLRAELAADTRSEVDTVTPDTAAPDTTPAETTVGDTTPVDVPSGETIAIGASACCLTFDAGRAVWVDGDALWMFRESTGVSAKLALGAGKKKDPALSGTLLVWADDRGGDWDLWGVDLLGLEAGTATPALVRGGPGDQTQPAVDGTGSAARVVWVENTTPASGALGKDIWTMRLGDAASARALTADHAEQDQPDVAGSIVVWSDYRNDPDAQYTVDANPMLNDADIYGWDLDADVELPIVVHPSKQLAPVIDGTSIVWLDWRGINPEPKYSEFQVYGKHWPNGPERFIAFSTWTRPELWRRPAVQGDIAVFAAEPSGNVQGFKTLLYAAHVDSGDPWIVTASHGIIDSVSLHAETAVWLGGGALGRAALIPTLGR